MKRNVAILIVYLKDSEATIAKVKDSFPKFLSQAKADDTVFFYSVRNGIAHEF